MMEGAPVLLLLVEDDPAHAEIVRRNLADAGVANRMVHLTDGQAALDYLLREGDWADPATSPRPDLVLLDLRLPKVDGLAVLRRIKSDPLLASVRTVILTTSQAGPDVDDTYDSGADDYVVKPLTFERFRRAASTCGFSWLAWNRAPR